MNGPPMEAQPVFAIVFMLVYLLIVVIGAAITALITCKIFSKTGFHWALGLLMFVPIANIVVPFFLAFAEWPIQKELRELRQQQGNSPGY